MSDGEASYHARRRANSASTGQKNAGEASSSGSGHVRASSVNILGPSLPQSDAHANTNGTMNSASAPPSTTKTTAFSPEEDDWERSSLSRLARLPDSRDGGDLDSISGRLRELGSYDSSSSSSTPSATNGVPDADFKSRRNTLRAGAAPTSGDFSFALPGVPSAPPADDWVHRKDKKGGSDSDGSGGGDVAARLPSAPPFLPTIQDQMPHITILTKPSSPKEELRVNPHFLPDPNSAGSSSHDAESPITPKNRSDHKTSADPSYSNSAGAPNIQSLTTATPNYGASPSTTTTSQAGSSNHRGYTPPNSVISPSNGSAINTTSMQQHQTFPPSAAGQMGGYFPHFPQPAGPGAYYNNQVQMNGTGAHRDEFGLEISGRPPPTELEPEVLGKVQKHAKYALSALNFEDLETAREELKKALRLLY